VIENPIPRFVTKPRTDQWQHELQERLTSIGLEDTNLDHVRAVIEGLANEIATSLDGVALKADLVALNSQLKDAGPSNPAISARLSGDCGKDQWHRISRNSRISMRCGEMPKLSGIDENH